MMLSPGEWQNGRVVPGRAVPDPDETGRLILSTNDLVRLRREGLLEFAGRADDMVKIRGNRVEPSEVEAAIRGHAGVADVAVLARQAGDTTAIDAFVVERPGTRLNSDDLFQHLRTVLPAHMVPSRVRLLPALPRLPNGKVDRLALTAEADKSR